ncbi:MAG: hypothetical protein AABX11_03765 [Nanoarchaeota archaeon]
MVEVISLLTTSLAQSVFVFILLFTLVFGILQKSKLFGEDKRQVDALIALAIALLVISVGYALDIITRLVPFLAVGLVIILAFILLIGLFYKDKFEAEDGIKYTVMGIAFLALTFAVLYFTGAWDYLTVLWNDPSSNIIGNVVIVLVLIGVFLLVWFGNKK